MSDSKYQASNESMYNSFVAFANQKENAHDGSLKVVQLLYENVIPVRCVSTNRDDKTSNLSIAISLHSPQSQTASSGQKVLTMELTDESDPFFLYTMEVGETEYHVLKKQQSLLVDFASFPANFNEYLDQCVSAAQPNQQGKLSSQPKFIAVLTKSSVSPTEAVFSIMETNQFKHLQHIALQFRSANDEQLQTYLADRLDSFKKANKELEKQVHDYEERCGELGVEVSKIQSLYQQAKMENQQQLAAAQVQHQQIVSEHKERSVTDTLTLQKEFDKFKADAENQKKAEIAILEAKIESLQGENKQLTQEKFKVTTDYQATLRNLETSNHDLSHAKTELQRYREKAGELEATRHTLETDLNSSRLRLASLEQEVVSKEEHIDNINSLLQATKEQKVSLEDALAVQKTQSSSAEQKLGECINEINKGNKIISQLTNDVRALKSKLKMKALVIKQQEEVLTQKTAEADSRANKLTVTDMSLKGKDAEIAQLKTALQTSKEQIAACQTQLEENQRVIQWLNKELNNARVSSTKPPASASKDVASGALPTITSPFPYTPVSMASSSLLYSHGVAGSPTVPSSSSPAVANGVSPNRLDMSLHSGAYDPLRYRMPTKTTESADTTSAGRVPFDISHSSSAGSRDQTTGFSVNGLPLWKTSAMDSIASNLSKSGHHSLELNGNNLTSLSALSAQLGVSSQGPAVSSFSSSVSPGAGYAALHSAGRTANADETGTAHSSYFAPTDSTNLSTSY